VQRLTIVALIVAFGATAVAAAMGGALWGRRRRD